MLEILQMDFMRNALIAGILVSIACGVMGSLVVVNKLSERLRSFQVKIPIRKAQNSEKPKEPNIGEKPKNTASPTPP